MGEEKWKIVVLKNESLMEKFKFMFSTSIIMKIVWAPEKSLQTNDSIVLFGKTKWGKIIDYKNIDLQDIKAVHFHSGILEKGWQ